MPEQVDAEDLARQLEAIQKELDAPAISMAARARLRERLAGLADQVAWVSEEESRKYLFGRIKEALQQLE